LSPVLFCLCVDGLLVKLSKAGIGCFVGNNFVGALAYADDIVLLAPTASVYVRYWLYAIVMLVNFILSLTLISQNVYLCSLVHGAFCMICRRLAHSSSVVTRLNLLIRSRIYRAFTYQLLIHLMFLNDVVTLLAKLIICCATFIS